MVKFKKTKKPSILNYVTIVHEIGRLKKEKESKNY
jgi:hypothetical protein